MSATFNYELLTTYKSLADNARRSGQRGRVGSFLVSKEENPNWPGGKSFDVVVDFLC